MLFCAGEINRMGRVEEGNTRSDYTQDERERQISLNATVLHAHWNGVKVNILDTPGYPDFVGEMKAALRASDNAVVVLSAVEGIGVGTERAWEFVEEYGLPDMEELVDYYERWYREAQRAHPEQVVPGGYYKTLISGAIQTFGWEMLLIAASDRRKFDKVLEGFFRLSLHHYEAWARTSVEAFICHDDMVWAEGPFMHPDFYRSSVFPRYRKLWDVLHEAGKIVLFCSDGTWTQFVDDVAEAGADGFIFEPTTSLDHIVERYGRTHVIVGSKVDCRTLTFGSREEIRSQIDATISLTEGCPGFMFAVGNHIPSNVPVENALFYFDYLRKRWRRP